MAHSGLLVGASIGCNPMLRAETRVAGVTGEWIPGPACAADLGNYRLPDSSHADRGIQEGRDAVLFIGQRKARDRTGARRVPLIVRRGRPSVALELVAQGTPDLSRDVSSSVASEMPQQRTLQEVCRV
jgi:hypothetical protein